jgi:LuxR family quorum sensing-dependent transcriptional regulator
MQGKNIVLEFADKLALTEGSESVAKLFVRLISEFGFSCFCAGRVSSERRRALGGKVWAQSEHAWLDHWNSQHYQKVDPIAWFWRKHPNRSVTTWSEAKLLDCGPRPDLFEEAGAFGLREGLAVGLKVAHGDFAALSIGTEREVEAESTPILGFAALLCVSRLSQLNERRPRPVALLSERQRECLSWAASGKTDWDISQILGLSHRTVQEHVARAIAKLRAANRAHAISMAILENHIEP